MDMSGAYQKGADINFPNAKITFDRFHVAEHATEAVNDTRKREYAAMMDREDEERRRSLKGQRYLFLKNYRNLDEEGQSRLRGLGMFPDLGRAYIFKESLRAVW